MKKIVQILIFILLFTGLMACQKQPVETPVDLSTIYQQNDVYYEIFVRSFADSNGDGIGDLNGITDNLDYLVNLGITAVWLMPINPSPSYHGYDVTDYYSINPDYGTLEDFQNLIDQAHARGIEIIMDLVINHTSDQHPWFISAQSSVNSPYRDYYIWNGNTAYQTFGGGMVDLNFNNPAVITEVENIMDFYLDMGVHGFRIDAAKHLIESNNATLDNALLILQLNEHMKAKDPNSFLVSEVLDMSYLAYADYYIGSDSLFDFYAAQNIWDKVGLGNNRYLFASNLKKEYDALREVKTDFVNAPVTGNHDMNRLASMDGFNSYYSLEKLALAARINLTLPGSPFIYYGEELGMKGIRYEGINVAGYGTVYDEYRRSPFLWGTSTYQTSWLPDNGANDAVASFADQAADSTSLYNVYKEIIKVREDNPALMYGNYFEPYVDNNSNIQGYVRYFSDENVTQAVLVLNNISSDPRTVDLSYLEILYGDLNIPAYGTLIVSIDPDLIGDYI